MAEKKLEAEAAIDLMRVQYERHRNDEEKRNGLIIVEAIYGKIDNQRIIDGLYHFGGSIMPNHCNKHYLFLFFSNRCN